MKLAFFSDTHTIHEEWYETLRKDIREDFDSADILIFTGDYSDLGSREDTESFCSWFNSRPNSCKIMIAGNHDFFFDTNVSKRNPSPQTASEIIDFLRQYKSITYLNNSGITIEGTTFWGSPINKWFYDWAFNRHEGEEIRHYWNLIPKETDVLLTHGPAYGVLDSLKSHGRVEHLGDRDLLTRIKEIQPKIFACGHIHEGYGEELINQTLFINSSSLNDRYEPVNDPIIVFTEEYNC